MSDPLLDFLETDESIYAEIPPDLPDLRLLAFYDGDKIVIRTRLLNVDDITSVDITRNGIPTALNFISDISWYEFRISDTALDDSFFFTLNFHRNSGDYITQTLTFKELPFTTFTQTITKNTDSSLRITFIPNDQDAVYSSIELIYTKFAGVTLIVPMEYDYFENKYVATVDDVTEVSGDIIPLPYAQYRFAVQHDSIIEQTDLFTYSDDSFVPAYEVSDVLNYDPPSLMVSFKPLNFIPVFIKLEFDSVVVDVVKIGDEYRASINPSPDASYTYRFRYKVAVDLLYTEEHGGTFPANFTDNLEEIINNQMSPPPGDDGDVILSGGGPGDDNGNILDGNP